jgi:hypothetical protein
MRGTRDKAAMNGKIRETWNTEPILKATEKPVPPVKLSVFQAITKLLIGSGAPKSGLRYFDAKIRTYPDLQPFSFPLNFLH